MLNSPHIPMLPILKEILGPCHSPPTKVETSNTKMAWGPVPHPDLERGMDENPNPLRGNCTGHIKVSDVVVRSPDALSLSSCNNVVDVNKHPTHTSKWERKRARQTIKRLQRTENSTSSFKVHFGKFGAKVEDT